MVRARRVNFVRRCVTEGSDGQLLQSGLVVEAAWALPNGCGDLWVPQPGNKLLGGVEATIDVHRTNHSFEGVGQNRLLICPTSGLFALAQQQRRAKVDRSSDLGQGRSIHDAGSQLGKLTLRKLGVLGKDVVRDRKAKHRIAEKFEAFV